MNNKKVIFWTVGLAIVASAIYESLFRPTANWLFKLALNLSTLGLEKYKDNIYIEIAKGFHEDISLDLYKLFIGLLLGFVISLIFILIKLKNQGDNDAFIHKFFKAQNKIINSNIFLSAYFLIVLIVTTLNIVQTVYINNAITYYDQLIAITSPYVDPHQIQIFNSEYAQIANKQDYIKLINQLNIIGDTGNQRLPKKISFIF